MKNHQMTILGRLSRIAVLLLLLTSIVSMQAQAEDEPYLKASAEDMAWWQDAKFGLFVHWGPVSLRGTEIGWSRGGERRGRGGTGTIPAYEYDNLYRHFNPTEFDADKWVEIAKAAGMKYIVFTSKHHDGFSMYDTKVSDYKITSPESPYGRDISGELADACHKSGLKLGYYYSPVDWRHPDYRSATHDRYIKFMHDQVRELCTNYGRLDLLWFDGLQIHPMSGSGGETYYDPAWAEDWDAKRLFKMIRGLQPHILINNRCGLEADYDTPEQHVGYYQLERPWESCITICKQWAWKPNDTMKSLTECIQTLARSAGGGGNLLFNVGPMPNGEIEAAQVKRLKEMGVWLKEYGDSIYGTRGGPIPPQSWGVSTEKGDTIYLHILCEDKSIAVPKMPKTILDARLMNGVKVDYSATDDGVIISIPDKNRDPHDTVVALTVK